MLWSWRSCSATQPDRYRVWCCSRPGRPTRATLLHALAAVGLVSVQAASGAVDAALRGYEELVDYWERTGAWTQRWTTPRNLADLLDLLDDHDATSFLRVSADEAPDTTHRPGNAG
jgi:hypothetical protein